MKDNSSVDAVANATAYWTLVDEIRVFTCSLLNSPQCLISWLVILTSLSNDLSCIQISITLLSIFLSHLRTCKSPLTHCIPISLGSFSTYYNLNGCCNSRGCATISLFFTYFIYFKCFYINVAPLSFQKTRWPLTW